MRPMQPMTFTDRLVPLENISNTRDLGGVRGAGGRPLQAGKLFRSGNPALGSGADLERLRTLKLDLVIDFRSEGEKTPGERPFGDAFRWVATPVLEGTMAMHALMPRLVSGSPESMAAMMLEVYRDFPVRYQSAFSGFLKAAEDGPTLMYHCTAGKDRTGFASLLLLAALGVAPEVIMANYLESNHWNQRFNAGIEASVGALGVDVAVLKPLLDVRKEYLEASMTTIGQQYGGMESYLREVLGVDVGRLRGAYLV